MSGAITRQVCDQLAPCWRDSASERIVGARRAVPAGGMQCPRGTRQMARKKNQKLSATMPLGWQPQAAYWPPWSADSSRREATLTDGAKNTAAKRRPLVPMAHTLSCFTWKMG